ncbi:MULTISPECIES: epoxide hydrolase family protein [Rhizobium/Agrobacterium group]|uniref:epoxide hydrolase family protein n=1 Tax=Rhizobium/Agrobacterium group TaxID=227290 RepID=UPI001ADBCA06|nr:MULTISPECIES: epoxide hydrolase family protein [Rhizobium/Agrobacterium group]MBO9112732.1 epoxide hydrolase [Agrobacterium sp. S2/73]QXZ76218.1 epoxide hydrolase [Agrobacterium sp. S7/73]QYA17234.1 epoxide hydrolase [Rhizobium sp. AB2/73]UEQ85192.1 epoxide hydrolase [Rhizobium sp. AB2/73]
MQNLIEKFEIAVEQSQLDDLAFRLENVRWPSSETARDASQGPTLDTMKNLVQHWSRNYDWRKCETFLNQFDQFRTVIDGVAIHFLHIRSAEPEAIPMLMTHGWPGSILEFRKVIGPLIDPVTHGGNANDAFHLIIPSLPGFGFSDQPNEEGWDIARIANAWTKLMQRLGYAKWVAQGGDWGAGVTTVMGYMAPEGLAALHLNMVLFKPTDEERQEADEEERKLLAIARRYDEELSAYNMLQSTRPQSLAYGIADSPVGLASWIYTLFQDLSGSDESLERFISLDEMIDNIMLYWLTNTGPSSIRIYWETAQSLRRAGMPSHPMPVPAGVAAFPDEIMSTSKRWAEKRFENLLHFSQASFGGHFAALENPTEFVQSVRFTFSHIRETN